VIGRVVDEDDLVAVGVGVAAVEGAEEVAHVVVEVEAVQRAEVPLDRAERPHESPPPLAGKIPRRIISSAARSLPPPFQRS